MRSGLVNYYLNIETMTDWTAKFTNVSATLAQDENGKDVYNNEKAQFGYLETKLRMYHLHVNKFPSPPNIDIKTLGKTDVLDNYTGDKAKAYIANNPYLAKDADLDALAVIIAALNYDNLIKAKLEEKTALTVAILRARWIRLGAFYRKLDDRRVTYEETIDYGSTVGVLPQEFTDGNRTAANIGKNVIVQNYVTALEKHPDLSTWVIYHAEIIWGICEYLFRTRGHHYKDSFIDLIQRLWRSNSSGNEEWPNDIAMVHVFRTSIHPFGIKARPIMLYHWIAHGKIPNSLMIRTAGSPNGVAFITTANAGIGVLKTESWYNNLYGLYKEQIDAIEEAATIINNSKYEFHLSANLYGTPRLMKITVAGKEKTLSEMEAIVGVIAPFIQAYVEWSKEQAKARTASVFSFANALALAKRASNAPVMTIKVVSMLNRFVEFIEDAENSKDLIGQVFPAITSEAEVAGTVVKK